MKNGALLAAAEAEFDVFLTCDQNIVSQQALAGRRLAVVVTTTNSWPVMSRNPGPIVEAVDAATAGSYATVAYPRPVRRRRFTPPG